MSELEMLTLSECWDRLRSQQVGRIGFDRGRGPRIHPVGYAVRGGDLLLTTSEDSELGSFVRMFGGGALVSFEADQVDPAQGERWSVLVGARVAEVDADAAQGRVPEAPPGHDEMVVRLTPVEVTGRRMTGTEVS
jgi:nitroimidazol reductase NimA-like FMN-containing flavoprotein (pyridoxamine 5'-phosphate oxidase superfamily)